MSRSIVEYDLRMRNGVVLFLPPTPENAEINLADPDVYAESATKLYPIGTLAWFPGMGKKYRYCKAGEALWGTKFLVANGNHVPDAGSYANVNGFYIGSCLAASVSAVGATEVAFADTIDKAKDFYEGAHMLHFDAARNTCYESSYIISGPPAAITTPWACTVQFHKAKKYAIILGDGFEIWCSPYSNILKGHSSDGVYDSMETFMGVPEIPIQSDYYFWLQTAGPVFITPDGWGANCPGYTANSREAVAGIAFGNMNSALTLTTAGLGYQRIGTVLSVTTGTDADALINLDLDLGH